MGTMSAGETVVKLTESTGGISGPSEIQASFVRSLVGSVPTVGVRGPVGVFPDYFFLSSFRGVYVAVPVPTGVNTGILKFGELVRGLPSDPTELGDRTIDIIPAFRPVVVPGIFMGSAVPRFAEPADVAIVTRSS